MVEKAAGRLCWVSMACAFTAGLLFITHRTLQPEMRAIQSHPIVAVNLVLVLLFSAGLVAAQRLHLVPGVYILRAGLFFEVLVAWCISFAETVLPLRPDEVVRGGSMVAVWIAFISMLVRHTPVVTSLVALLGGLTWPAAYLINLTLNGTDPLPASRLMVWLMPIIVVVFWVYFLNKRMFRIEAQAERAEELGSYQLVHKIGQGGMGDVWLARHRLIARDAAIKIIRPELIARDSARQAEMLRRRFEREARATATLQCPHTIYLFDFGMAHNGSFYFVMELLNGISFQRLVERFGPLPAGRVVFLLKQVCLSLEEAHRHHLVHRDIKPSNLFACRVGMQTDFVKVLDFGLVKRLDSGESALLTMDGTSAGTPAYMSPEAALGHDKVDGRMDIYSLGCVAYFLLTGHMVFEESTPTAVALAHVQKEPIPPGQRSELPVPASLERVLMKCLAKDPKDRPRSAQDLSQMLEECTDVPQWNWPEAAEWWARHLPQNATEPQPMEEAAPPSPVRVM